MVVLAGKYLVDDVVVKVRTCGYDDCGECGIACKQSGRIVGEVIRWTVVLARKTSSRYRSLNGNACILGKVGFRVCFCNRLVR